MTENIDLLNYLTLQKRKLKSKYAKGNVQYTFGNVQSDCNYLRKEIRTNIMITVTSKKSDVIELIKISILCYFCPALL